MSGGKPVGWVKAMFAGGCCRKTHGADSPNTKPHTCPHFPSPHTRSHLNQLEDAVGVAEGKDPRCAVQVSRRHLGPPLVHVVLLGEGPRTACGKGKA